MEIVAKLLSDLKECLTHFFLHHILVKKGVCANARLGHRERCLMEKVSYETSSSSSSIKDSLARF